MGERKPIVECVAVEFSSRGGVYESSEVVAVFDFQEGIGGVGCWWLEVV